jgi:hypothetical protein
MTALCRQGWSAVVVGDAKTPDGWSAEHVDYLSLRDQHALFGDLSKMIPENHYARKNLGYLYAMSRGATHILETDDDAAPYATFGQHVSLPVDGRLLDAKSWVNVYKYFTETLIWPRGLPLDHIHSAPDINGTVVGHTCPIQQFLVDRDPDVDAIYRLIYNQPVFFHADRSPVILSDRTWSPFNSQNTLFFAEAFPLMYLPAHVNFRVTDIWRSFVAQTALWSHGRKVAYHTSTMEQIRNAHDMMDDFRQEIIGHTSNTRLAAVLETAQSQLTADERASVSNTAKALWSALMDTGDLPSQERHLIERWFDLLDNLTTHPTT